MIREEDGRGGSFDGRRFTFFSFLSTIFLFFGVGARGGSGGTLKELRRVFTMVEGMLWKSTAKNRLRERYIPYLIYCKSYYYHAFKKHNLRVKQLLEFQKTFNIYQRKVQTIWYSMQTCLKTRGTRKGLSILRPSTHVPISKTVTARRKTPLIFFF